MLEASLQELISTCDSTVYCNSGHVLAGRIKVNSRPLQAAWPQKKNGCPKQQYVGNLAKLSTMP